MAREAKANLLLISVCVGGGTVSLLFHPKKRKILGRGTGGLGYTWADWNVLFLFFVNHWREVYISFLVKL